MGRKRRKPSPKKVFRRIHRSDGGQELNIPIGNAFAFLDFRNLFSKNNRSLFFTDGFDESIEILFRPLGLEQLPNGFSRSRFVLPFSLTISCFFLLKKVGLVERNLFNRKELGSSIAIFYCEHFSTNY